MGLQEYDRMEVTKRTYMYIHMPHKSFIFSFIDEYLDYFNAPVILRDRRGGLSRWIGTCEESYFLAGKKAI